jgi:hypothetical protein
MVGVFVLGGLQEGGIENLFLDSRMHGKRLADLRGQLLLFGRALRFLEFRKQTFDLSVVRFQKRYRV